MRDCIEIPTSPDCMRKWLLPIAKHYGVAQCDIRPYALQLALACLDLPPGTFDAACQRDVMRHFRSLPALVDMRQWMVDRVHNRILHQPARKGNNKLSRIPSMVCSADVDVRPIPKAIIIRSEKHLARVRQLPCCLPICGYSWHIEAHHITFAMGQPARGRKVSDEFVVPLCPRHHRTTDDSAHFWTARTPEEILRVAAIGRERAWWEKHRVDPMALALQFWTETQGSST